MVFSALTDLCMHACAVFWIYPVLWSIWFVYPVSLFSQFFFHNFTLFLYVFPSRLVFSLSLKDPQGHKCQSFWNWAHMFSKLYSFFFNLLSSVQGYCLLKWLKILCLYFLENLCLMVLRSLCVCVEHVYFLAWGCPSSLPGGWTGDSESSCGQPLLSVFPWELLHVSWLSHWGILCCSQGILHILLLRL